ncbi:MAG TPA: DegQ family serine endoprotease [Pyrinomonadaceae bacterium]|nr:DegQ family serine endoprotease [Pyrinomonadaceae bacterium]
MKTKAIINKLGSKSISALRQYPLQILGLLTIAILFSTVLTVAFFVPHKANGQSVLNQNQTQNTISTTDNSGLTWRASYADVVEKVSSAVVTVRSERKVKTEAMENPFANDPMFRQFFGGKVPKMQQKPQVERGLGSGVIIESNGTILTNNHVVEGSTTVKVDLPDKRTFTAKVVGTDAASDLAVLKIEAANLPILSLGDSDKVRVGDVVLAIGNPLGLRQTVTSGIISAKGRQTGLSDGSFEDFLQTDAPINQGNSGGALVNLNGELIGINSQILSPSGGNIGIGFSIPSNMAKSVMAQLLKDGKVHRGMLGIGIQDVTSELAENFGLKEVRGVIVNSVNPNSPAAKGGLKQGDVILSLNGTNIGEGNELRNKISETAPNTVVTIGYLREGKEQNAKVTLGEFENKTNIKDKNDGENDGTDQGKLGVTLQPLTPQIAQQLGLKGITEGLVVTDVQSGSPAEDAGLAQGDVIMQINRQEVKTVDEVQNAIAKSKNNSVLLLVNRQGQTTFVTVNIGE